MKTEYKRSSIPNFKNENGSKYIYGKKYVEILLGMIDAGTKTKTIGKNKVTISREIDNDSEWVVYVNLERL